jgi:hypothetical protein
MPKLLKNLKLDSSKLKYDFFGKIDIKTSYLNLISRSKFLNLFYKELNYLIRISLDNGVIITFFSFNFLNTPLGAK